MIVVVRELEIYQFFFEIYSKNWSIKKDQLMSLIIQGRTMSLSDQVEILCPFLLY